MEVYKQIKKDLGLLIVWVFFLMVLLNFLDYGIDSTDRDGFNRSGVELITDYGTGLQYLYRGGGLVPRLDNNGKHMRIEE